MIALLAAALVAFQADDVAKLIRDLEANDIETREKATVALLAMGAKAVEPLEKAAGNTDGETAARLKAIAGRIKSRAEFRDQLIAGQNNGMSYQHIVNAKQQRSMPDEDIDGVINELCGGAGNLMLKNYLVQAIAQLRILTAIPGLVKMLRDNQAWSYAQNALMQLGAAKETAGAISEMLQEKDNLLVLRAVQLATSLSLRDAAPAIKTLLVHSDATIRTNAASALVSFGMPGDITEKLKSKHAKERVMVLQAMVAVGLQDAASVEPLVADEDALVRAQALTTLAMWGRPPSAELVEKLLGDKEAAVREAAVACAVSHASLGKAVLARLKDESGRVRAAVLERLNALPFDDVMSTLLGLAGEAATREQAAYGIAVLLHNAGARVHRVMTEIVGKVDAAFIKSVNGYLETIKAATPVYEPPPVPWQQRPGRDWERWGIEPDFGGIEEAIERPRFKKD